MVAPLVGGVLPHKNMLLDTLLVQCTGATGIQNSFWPLILLFDTPTYTLLELKQRNV